MLLFMKKQLVDVLTMLSSHAFTKSTKRFFIEVQLYRYPLTFTRVPYHNPSNKRPPEINSQLKGQKFNKRPLY